MIELEDRIVRFAARCVKVCAALSRILSASVTTTKKKMGD